MSSTKLRPYTLKAQYYETDQMSIVHHSNYIRWFESARIDAMTQMGIPYKELEARGIQSPVLTVCCEYKQMTRFDDPISITVRIKEYNGIRLTLAYEVYNQETGVLNAVGETSHCYINKEGRLVTLKKAAPEVHAVMEKYAPKPH